MRQYFLFKKKYGSEDVFSNGLEIDLEILGNMEADKIRGGDREYTQSLYETEVRNQISKPKMFLNII